MRSSHYLLAMHIGSEVLALLRNVFLARLLGPAELGTAAFFAIGLRLLEMGSDCASDRLLIQADDGNDPQMQATAQGLEIVRGVISGAIFVALLVPLSLLLGHSFSPFSFIVLGLVPVSRGLVHLDYKRFQRDLHFRPAAWIEIAAGLVAVFAAAPLVVWLGDYRAVLTVALVQGVTLVVASHWMAERPYRIAFEKELVLRFLRFGWPLALNGLLMFTVFQGDRLVVACACTPAELGCYSVCFQLSLIPVLILSRLTNSVFLPILSRCQHDEMDFRRVFQLGNLLVSLVAVWLGVAIAVLEGPVVRFLYGSDFLLGGAMFCLLAIMQSGRLFRSLSSVAAVASGDSRQPLIVNLFRLSGVAAAVAMALLGWGVVAIAAASCFGELVAAAASMLILRSRSSIPLSDWKLPAIQFSGLILLVGLLEIEVVSQLKVIAVVLVAVGVGLTQAVCILRCWNLLSISNIADFSRKAESGIGALE